VGEVLVGKYRIERILGEGGMGIVVAARHLQLDELVAIKFLLPELVSEPEVVARFQREARAAVKIKGEHVVRVTDVGILDTGEPFMVMEYLEGQNLADRLQQRGAMPVGRAVEFVLHAVEAIAEAHSLGIVHRDLKPANLFVVTRPDGTESVKVLDFGISKATTTDGSVPQVSLTHTRSPMGSPLYMSPEQIASPRSVDARADIWALGVTLFELIAGCPPFSGETLFEVHTRIVNQPAPFLCELRPEAPPALAAVVDRCLQKKPEERYANIGELAAGLAEFAPPGARQSVERISRLMPVAKPAHRESGPEAGPSDAARVPAAEPARSGRERTEGSWGQTTRPLSRKRTALVGAVVAGSSAVLCAALAAWWGLARARHAVPAAASSWSLPMGTESAGRADIAFAEPRLPAASASTATPPVSSGEAIIVSATSSARVPFGSTRVGSVRPPKAGESSSSRDPGASSPAPARSGARVGPSPAPVDLYGERL
jgi:serine/threonine-protein kinase